MTEQTTAEEPAIPWDEGDGSPIFDNLANAFLRLLRQAPVKHLPFVEQVEERKPVKVTLSNVALEAGEHRQRFQGYPRLAKLVRTFRPTHGVVEKTMVRLAKRRERIEDLERMLGQALARQGEAIAIADDLRADLAAKEGEVQRLKAKLRQRACVAETL